MSYGELVSEFLQKLEDEINSINYEAHENEGDLLNDLFDLSPKPTDISGGRVEMETYKLHKSIDIYFTNPNSLNVRKEIADMLFDVKARLPDEIYDRRRVFITQAKFDDDMSDWGVDTDQFYFIHTLPLFVIMSPQTCQSFNLEEFYTTENDYDYTGNTFAVGLFGGNSEPFLLRTERILKGIGKNNWKNLNYRKSAHKQSREEGFLLSNFGTPSPHDYLTRVLEKMFRGTYGQIVKEDSELERFVDHIRDIATARCYSSLRNSSLCTDGGELDDENAEFVYVRFTIDLRDTQDYNYDYNKVLYSSN